MEFHLAKHDHLYILTHPDYPDLEVATNSLVITDFNEAKKVAVSIFNQEATRGIFSHLQENKDCLDFYDEAWMDGELCRVDWSQGSKEGQEILVRLKSEFPDETIYDDEKPKNVVSQYTSSREDYPNEILNYYNFREPTSEEKDKFGLDIYSNLDAWGMDWDALPADYELGDEQGLSPYRNMMGKKPGEINSWFAFKFDRTTKEVKCKIVLPREEIAESIRDEIKAVLPDEFVSQHSTFYARIHNADKSVSPEIDMYFRTTGYVVNEFCKDQGLQYPYGDYKATKDKENKTFIWGLVYNTDTKKFKHIKGYARYFR